jgi:hypothetical protein
MGVLQDAADLARVYLHSAGAGIPEWAQRQFGDPRVADATDAQVAQSKANQGFGGSVANVAGFFAPGGVISSGIKAVRAAPAAVRAVPRIAEAAPAAERAVMGFVNPGRANFYSRLGLGEVPTVTGAIGQNVAAAVKAHPFLTGAALVGGPLAALADYGGSATSSAGAAKPAAQPKAQPQAKAQPKAAAPAAPEKLSPLDALIGQVAAAQGGKISLNQLGAIGDFVSKTSPEMRHPATYKDIAAQALMSSSNAGYNALITQAQQAKAAGDIARAQALQNQAIMQQRQDMLSVLGQNPLDLMTAQQIEDARRAAAQESGY